MHPEFEQLKLERGEAIDWIIFDRPDAANSLSTQLLTELSRALALLSERGAPVIGIRGSGRGFSAGVDLSEYNAQATPMQDASRLRGNLDRWLEIWNHPKPIIVAIHGYCMGIAAQLPSFADLTVVASDAKIGEPGIPLGGGYIAPTWVAQAGTKRAKELSFLPGNWVSGETAAEWGWANAAVAPGKLIACVEELASRIALVPSPILAMKKRSINRAAEAAGFITGLAAIAESDALLHFEPSVMHMRERLGQEGLREVLATYRGDSSSEIFSKHTGTPTDV